MQNALLYSFFTILCGPTYGLAADSMQPKRPHAPPKWVRVSLWGLLFALGAAIRLLRGFQLPPANLIQLVLQAAAIFISYRFFYSSSLAVTVLIHLILLLSVASAEPIAALAVWLRFGRAISGNISQPDMVLGSLVGAFASNIAVFTSAALWRHFQLKKRVHRGSWMLVLMAFCLLFPTYSYCAQIADGHTSISVYSFFSLVGILFFMLLMIWMQLRLAEKDELAQQLSVLQNQHKLEQQHYQSIETRRQELSKLSHDLNNLLSSVLILLENNNIPQAQETLRGVVQRVNQTKEHPYCSIPIVNAILTEKAEECSSRNIRLETNLLFPPKLQVTPVDLCSIFSNLLDNAIRACSQLPEDQRVIQLSVNTRENYLLIRCVNPAKKAPGSRPEGTGLGLLILNDLAQAYQGDFQTSFEKGQFTAILILLAAF